MTAPASPSAWFDPTCSGCQCVLKSFATRPPGKSFSAATTSALEAAAPLSTTTWPAPVASTAMLPPAPPSTVRSFDTVTRVSGAATAMPASGANAAPTMPPTTPFKTALRLARGQLSLTIAATLNAGDLARAIADALELEARLVDHGQV